MTYGLDISPLPSGPSTARADRRPTDGRQAAEARPSFQLPPEASDRAVARREEAHARRDQRAAERNEPREAPQRRTDPPRRADPPRRTDPQDGAERSGRSDLPRAEKSSAPADPVESEAAAPPQPDGGGEPEPETTSDEAVAGEETGPSAAAPPDPVLSGLAPEAPVGETQPDFLTDGGVPSPDEGAATTAVPDNSPSAPATGSAWATAAPAASSVGQSPAPAPSGGPAPQEAAGGETPAAQTQAIPQDAASESAGSMPDLPDPVDTPAATPSSFADHLKSEAPAETSAGKDPSNLAEQLDRRADPAIPAGGQGPSRAAAAAQTQVPSPPGPVFHQVPLGAVPIEIGLKTLAGINRFEIRLDPAELGRIDVRLDIGEDGEVKAHLVVDRVETLALLQRDAKTLERAFEQAGLKPSEGGVDLSLRDPSGDGRFQHQNRDERGHERGAGAQDRNAAAEKPERQPVQQASARWRGAAGVDLRI